MVENEKFLIVVGGPTASGKTSFAIQLANHFETEILSVDSRQFYREMSIGTAKPTIEELAAARHHFVGSMSIEQDFSVGQYEKEAIALLDQLFLEHDVVVMTGGSGLFINAVCQGLDDFPSISDNTKEEVMRLYETEGIEALQNQLKLADPDYYERVDLSNKRRLMRAVEVFLETGQPYSSFLAKNKVSRNFTPIFLQVHHPRIVLYQRINQRVERMMQEGLIEEVKGLIGFREKNALKTVGYQEVFDFLDGNISLKRAVELIQQNSRRYAKRQLTWMRRDAFWKRFRPDDWALALEYIQASRAQNLAIKHYTNAVDLPANIIWDKGTVGMVALWRKGEVIEFSRLIRRGKKVILNTDSSPKEYLLKHEVELLLEELNN